MLLAPEQQPPPEPLTAVVEAAVQAWVEGQRDAAFTHLQQATTLAQEMDYL
jgi:hypothetical protein